MIYADNPISRFLDAMARAQAVERHDATAMTVATADARGRPSARMVSLKSVDARGFTFFTNRKSRKSRELEGNPFAALCIHWPALQEQVRVEGRVELVSDEESDAYFSTRPRDNQIGSWASEQSMPLSSREELKVRVREFEARFAGPVPRPPHWGGYRVVPSHIEFWHSAPARLHDRRLYIREGNGWIMQLLDP